jgi:hypothetical protein
MGVCKLISYVVVLIAVFFGCLFSGLISKTGATP